MKRIKAREENFYQDSIENKQKGKNINVGIILSIAAFFKYKSEMLRVYIRNLP